MKFIFKKFNLIKFFVLGFILMGTCSIAAVNPNIEILEHLRSELNKNDQYLVLMETGQLYPEPLKINKTDQIDQTIDQNMNTKYYARLRVLNIKKNLYVQLRKNSSSLPLNTPLYSIQAAGATLLEAKKSLVTLIHSTVKTASPLVSNYLNKIKMENLSKAMGEEITESNTHMLLNDRSKSHQFLRDESGRLIFFNLSQEELINPHYQEDKNKFLKYFYPFTLYLSLYPHKPSLPKSKLGCLNPADENRAWAMKLGLSFTTSNDIFYKTLQDDQKKKGSTSTVQIPAGRGCVLDYRIERLHVLSNLSSPAKTENALVVVIIKTTLSAPAGSELPNESYMVVSGELNGQP